MRQDILPSQERGTSNCIKRKMFHLIDDYSDTAFAKSFTSFLNLNFSNFIHSIL